MGVAVAAIDMRTHKGQHPRMGAVDVVPFIPVRNVTMKEAIELSRQVAADGGDKARAPGLPLRGVRHGAAPPQPRRHPQGPVRGHAGEAASCRSGRLISARPAIHPTAGVTAVGARMPLVAYNVNLGTADLEIANDIARKVRHLSGGLRYCKAIGIDLKDRGIVQVSMNMTDYTRTALYRVFELIRIEARRWGVPVVGSEIVGLVPMGALIDTAAYYLQLENFKTEQVLESRIYE